MSQFECQPGIFPQTVDKGRAHYSGWRQNAANVVEFVLGQADSAFA